MQSNGCCDMQKRFYQIIDLVPEDRRSLHDQSGSALILAMLVAGLVAIMAVQFAQGFVVKASIAEQRILQQRMDTYLHGAEAMAKAALRQDRQTDIANDGVLMDHLQEAWAQALPPLSTDEGFVQVRIRDAQGMYNVNNLLAKTAYFGDAGADIMLRFSAQQKQFMRLLQALPGASVSEQQAIMMVEALVDWIDDDDQVSGAGGAESLYYSSERPPRNPSNQGLQDVSELLLVRHFNTEVVAALKPYVTVLPMLTPLNVNTAPALVLAAINEERSLTITDSVAVTTLLQRRQQEPFANVADFLSAGYPADGPSALAESVPIYGISSQFFHVYVRVQLANQSRSLAALIYRDESVTRTLSRVFGSDLDDQFLQGDTLL
jgi:general secretion pathway protein K